MWPCQSKSLPIPCPNVHMEILAFTELTIYFHSVSSDDIYSVKSYLAHPKSVKGIP